MMFPIIIHPSEAHPGHDAVHVGRTGSACLFRRLRCISVRLQPPESDLYAARFLPFKSVDHAATTLVSQASDIRHMLVE
jgi:hypothetical protein